MPFSGQIDKCHIFYWGWSSKITNPADNSRLLQKIRQFRYTRSPLPEEKRPI